MSLISRIKFAALSPFLRKTQILASHVFSLIGCSGSDRPQFSDTRTEKFSWSPGNFILCPYTFIW